MTIGALGTTASARRWFGAVRQLSDFASRGCPADMPLQAQLELPVFRGPLDLLLTLIERRRLEITEVSLAMVADQYLQAVRALPEPDPELLAEFLVIGARLVLIKSRALLPTETARDEEPVDDLAERLELYRQFKEAALSLGARLETGQQAYPHPARTELADLLPELAPVEAETLRRLLLSIGRRRRPAPSEPEPLAPRASIGEQVERLRARLRQGPVTWHELAPTSVDEQVALFLAVLELVKLRELRAVQAAPFGPIRLVPRDTGGEAAGGAADQVA